MATLYCGWHGIDYRGSECPRCMAEERHEEILRQQKREHEESLNVLSDVRYKQFNPGQHSCPHCLFQTLKRNASRCPLCHGEVNDEYWVQVQKREKEEAIRRAEIAAKEKEEFERTKSERGIKQKIQSLEDSSGIIGSFVLFLCGLVIYIFPYLSAWSTGRKSEPAVVLLIPGFNWLVWLYCIIFWDSDHSFLKHGLLWIFGVMLFCVVVYSWLMSQKKTS